MPWRSVGSRCTDTRFFDLGSSWRWVVSFTTLSVAFPSREQPRVPTAYVAGWTPEPAWTIWRSEHSRSFQNSNSDPSVVQPVGSHIPTTLPRLSCTHWYKFQTILLKQWFPYLIGPPPPWFQELISRVPSIIPWRAFFRMAVCTTF
jgi:hypothetical protein